jgi:four helix bundle protein
LENRDFAKALEKRTRKSAVAIIRLSTQLPKNPEGIVVKTQVTKSGTSIGANYREANRARSKADFKNKIKICEGEASETQYWLHIIIDLEWVGEEKVRPLYEECSELLAIFTSIGKNE